MDHSSLVRLKNVFLSTLGVMLISAMPDEPAWVYLGLRCAVTLVRPSCTCLKMYSLSCPTHVPPPNSLAPLEMLAILPCPTKFISQH